jgi:hypothetical protein
MRENNKLGEITSYGGFTAGNDEEFSGDESDASPSP